MFFCIIIQVVELIISLGTTIIRSAFRETTYPVDGTHSAGRDAMDGLGPVCLVSGYTSGLRPPNPLHRGWVYRPAPEALVLGESAAFLEMLGACGLRPCAQTHLKKGLVLHSSGWWDGGQIPIPSSG